jgi:uncharacterized protein YjaG (DUF416 family)
MAILDLNILLTLDKRKKLAFAYLASERVFPYYQHFSDKHDFGDSSLLREAINYVREAILPPNEKDKKLDFLLSEVERNYATYR